MTSPLARVTISMTTRDHSFCGLLFRTTTIFQIVHILILHIPIDRKGGNQIKHKGKVNQNYISNLSKR